MSERKETQPRNLQAGRAEEKTLWHALARAEVESLLETGEHGLSQEEAGRRLESYGPNHLEEQPPPSELELLATNGSEGAILAARSAAALAKDAGLEPQRVHT